MTHAIAPLDGSASTAQARPMPEDRAITTAHDAQELHDTASQKPEIEASSAGLRQRGGVDSITRAEAKALPGHIAQKLGAYSEARGTERRRQCVAELRKAMATLEPEQRHRVSEEMERISAAHLWHVLELPGKELRPNSRVEQALVQWAVLLQFAPKVAKWTVMGAYGWKVNFPLLQKLLIAETYPGWKAVVAATLGTIAVQGISHEIMDRGSQALFGKALIAANRNMALTPQRDAANEDKTPEITEMISGVLDSISPNSSADRSHCAAMLGWLMVEVPPLREALANFAVSGDAATLDESMEMIDSLHFNDKQLAGVLPLIPEYRHAQGVLEARRWDTDDAIEAVISRQQAEFSEQAGAEAAQAEEIQPDLNDSTFCTMVKAELKKERGYDVEPLGSKEDIYLAALHEVQVESSKNKSPAQILKSCLLELRSEKGTINLEMEGQMNALIAKHREAQIARNVADHKAKEAREGNLIDSQG